MKKQALLPSNAWAMSPDLRKISAALAYGADSAAASIPATALYRRAPTVAGGRRDLTPAPVSVRRQ